MHNRVNGVIIMTLDTIDVKILEVLQQNARVSVSELSKRVNLSLSAVSDRAFVWVFGVKAQSLPRLCVKRSSEESLYRSSGRTYI